MFVRMSRCAAVVGRLCIAVVAMLTCSGIAHAGAITIDEEGLNAIFSQESFGDTPISIRFNPPQMIYAPQFLVINTIEDYQGLYSLVPDPAPTVAVFFVDALNFCGVTVDEFYGCAELPGNFQALSSTVAAEEPSKLIAHELGHNLGLGHESLGLMTSHLGFGGLELFEDQVATMLQSPLVQVDANGQRFVQVTPIAIVATPEPSALFLLSGGLGALLIIRRRKYIDARRMSRAV